jgi:hypothetical protein
MALLLRENTTQDWRVGLVGGPDTLLPAPTAAAELARWVAWGSLGCCECDGSQMRSLVLHLSPRSPLWPHLGPASAGRLGGDGGDRPKANVSVLLKPVARAARFPSITLVPQCWSDYCPSYPTPSNGSWECYVQSLAVYCSISRLVAALVGHDLGVWSHCYRCYPTLDSPSIPKRKAVQAVQRSLRMYAWHRIVSLVVAHAATSTRGHRRRRRLLALLSLAKVLPEPLHAAVRVTNFARRLYAHIHSRTAYAYAHTTRHTNNAAAAQPVAFLLTPQHLVGTSTTAHATRRPRRPLTLEGVTSLHGWRRKPGT